MIKKMNQNIKAGRLNKWMVLPVLAALFLAFSFKVQKTTAPVASKKYVIALDAGHGGDDAGAQFSTSNEKQLALKLAKKIISLNSDPNLTFMLTRESDQNITPKERAEKANQNKVDMLLSLHLDAVGDKEDKNKSGLSVFISRDQYPNSTSSKVLASSVIQAFEKNYGIPVFPNPQQREKGIWILQATNCPSVLIEAGVINNSTDFTYINSDAGQEQFAKNLLQAVSDYVNRR